MKILIIVLAIIFGIVAMALVAALFIRKTYHVESEIVLNASKEKTFDYLKHIKNQDNFSKWVMTDPAMQKMFKGEDGTVGFVYGWKQASW
jgi:hypothetical protein